MANLSKNKRNLHPRDDGILFINIYSKGNTELGRMLSNFYTSRFEHPKYGWFNTVEGLWYWLKTGKHYEWFRTMLGQQAKSTGSGLPSVFCRTFKEDIVLGIRQKIAQNEKLMQLLEDSILPFEHFYYYGNPVDDVVTVYDKLEDYPWMIECIEQVRHDLKMGNAVLPLIDIGRPPKR